MSSLDEERDKELVFLILQFLDDKKFKETVHKLEQESGVYFNMHYFEDTVKNGDWNEVDNYLSGFTKYDDNEYSKKMFFEIRKQKFLEALDRKDRAKAAEILMKDLKVFSDSNKDLYEELTKLLVLENFRENPELSKYGDTESSRGLLFAEIKMLMGKNPLFHDKLNFPSIKPARLRTLINQSLKWQHQLCKNPKPNPEINTLFVDHLCVNNLPSGAVPPLQLNNPTGFPLLRAHAAIQPVAGPLPSSLLGRMTSASSVPRLSASAGPIISNIQDFSDKLKHSRTPMNKPDISNKQVLKRKRPLEISNQVADESSEKSIIWKLTEVNEPSQCRSLRLPDSLTAMRVSRMIYTNSGSGILALCANAVHKLWKWHKNGCNPTGVARADTVPKQWQPCSGISMTNCISQVNPEDAVPCFALSKNDSYVMSASGGKISIFNMINFKTLITFKSPPPAATFLAFLPQDNNIIAIGMDDSSILIYKPMTHEVRTELQAHQKRITGLAFSNILNVLVSSGADSQLCVWSTDTWKKRTSIYLQSPLDRSAASLADTLVQFHQDQTHLLAVQETHIAINEVPNLTCLKQWVPQQARGRITCATYSCDGQSIYVSFENGGVGVLTSSSLCLKCQINFFAYLPSPPSASKSAYPLVIAAHPSKPNQFALGLTDGGVCVIEPLESKGEWGTIPPEENSAV